MLGLVPHAVDFAHVAGGDEGVDVVLFHEIHYAGELVLGEEGLDFHMGVAGIAAMDVIEGAAALKGFHDVGADFLAAVGNDADALALVHAGHEIVQGEAVHPGADQADDDHPERVDGKGGAADDGAGDGHGHADVEVQVLVDNLREDVQAAGGGVDRKKDCLRDADHEHEADQVHQGVAHDGGLAGLDEALVGAHLLPEFQERAQDHRRIHGLGAEFLADQQPGHDQKNAVDDRDYPGDLDGKAYHRENVGDDDGETGDGPEHEFAGHHEIIDGGGRDGHAQGHDEQLFPELPGAKILQDLFHGVVSFSL